MVTAKIENVAKQYYVQPANRKPTKHKKSKAQLDLIEKIKKRNAALAIELQKKEKEKEKLKKIEVAKKKELNALEAEKRKLDKERIKEKIRLNKERSKALNKIYKNRKEKAKYAFSSGKFKNNIEIFKPTNVNKSTKGYSKNKSLLSGKELLNSTKSKLGQFLSFPTKMKKTTYTPFFVLPSKSSNKNKNNNDEDEFSDAHMFQIAIASAIRNGTLNQNSSTFREDIKQEMKRYHNFITSNSKQNLLPLYNDYTVVDRLFRKFRRPEYSKIDKQLFGTSSKSAHSLINKRKKEKKDRMKLNLKLISNFNQGKITLQSLKNDLNRMLNDPILSTQFRKDFNKKQYALQLLSRKNLPELYSKYTNLLKKPSAKKTTTKSSTKSTKKSSTKSTKKPATKSAKKSTTKSSKKPTTKKSPKPTKSESQKQKMYKQILAKSIKQKQSKLKKFSKSAFIEQLKAMKKYHMQKKALTESTRPPKNTNKKPSSKSTSSSKSTPSKLKNNVSIRRVPRAKPNSSAALFKGMGVKFPLSDSLKKFYCTGFAQSSKVPPSPMYKSILEKNGLTKQNCQNIINNTRLSNINKKKLKKVFDDYY